MAFHNNTIYIVSDFSAFGIWDGNVTISITESLQDAADTMDALQEVLQVPISPSFFHRNRSFFLPILTIGRFRSNKNLLLRLCEVFLSALLCFTFEYGADVFPDGNAAAVVELAER